MLSAPLTADAHIQDRIMSYDKDMIGFYGTPGHKHGLERVLFSDDEYVLHALSREGELFRVRG